MQSLLPNIWSSLSPQQRAAIAAGNSSRLLTQEERDAGMNLDTLDELFGCGGFAAGRVYLDASGAVK